MGNRFRNQNVTLGYITPDNSQVRKLSLSGTVSELLDSGVIPWKESAGLVSLVNSDSSVGIGTSSPSYTLDINGLTPIAGNVVVGIDGGSSSGVAATNIAMRSFLGQSIWQLVTKDSAFAISVGGSVDSTRVATFLSTGRVGIGDSAPDDTLHISSAADTQFRITSQDAMEASAGTENIASIGFEGHKNNLYRVTAQIKVRQDGTWSTVTSNNAPTAIEFFTQGSGGGDTLSTARLTIKNSGLIGVANTLPTARLEIDPGLSDSGSIGGEGFLQGVRVNPTSGRMGYGVVNTNSFLSSGSINSGFGFYHPFDAANANVDYPVYSIRTGTETGADDNAASSMRFRFKVTKGGDVFNENGIYGTLSDEREKKNITNLNNSLDKISQLRPINYALKKDPLGLSKVGFTAQAMSGVFPDMVKPIFDNQKERLSINTVALIPILVKTIQELHSRIEVIESGSQ